MQNHKGVTGGPLDITEKDTLQNVSDAALKGKKPEEIDPDERAKLDAVAELSREKNDSYMVKSDLEDDDERGPSPGMKEQE